MHSADAPTANIATTNANAAIFMLDTLGRGRGFVNAVAETFAFCSPYGTKNGLLNFTYKSSILFAQNPN